MTGFDDLVRAYLKATKEGRLNWSSFQQEEDSYEDRAIQAPLRDEGKKVIIKKSENDNSFLLQLEEENEEPINTKVFDNGLNDNYHFVSQIWNEAFS
jgi:hypothetical protein